MRLFEEVEKLEKIEETGEMALDKQTQDKLYKRF
jgi:hypothetical protein